MLPITIFLATFALVYLPYSTFMKPNYYLLVLLCFLFALSCGNKDEACKDIICLNGGNCNNGTCNCPEGFGGSYCELPACGAGFCEHGGTCVNGTCDCPEGYLGDFCETVTPCALLNCPENAHCKTLTDQTVICECDDWYTGTNCTEVRSNYYGNYTATESCLTGIFTNFVSISSSISGVQYFNMVGPAQVGSGNFSVKAQLSTTDPNKFTIPNQTISADVSIIGTSTGSRDPANGNITVSYKVTYSTGSIQNCTLTLVK